MKRLAPDLFDRRFRDLVEMGRARLPGIAPDWTDHNAHDPGITLLELLAWVTEAQLYSLGRMRRDERAAYAALSGIAPRGSEPARGLIWPDPRASGPAPTQSMVIPADAGVRMVDAETPVFRPAARLLWVAGQLERVVTRLADGGSLDHTAVNARGGTPFLPFGRAAGRDDVLLLDFACAGADGLFPPRRQDADGALWPIGIRADGQLAGDPAAGDTAAGSPLTATLVTPAARVPVAIAADSSAGLLRTGVLLLDLAAVADSPRRFTLELRAPRGCERPPRLLRIAPNVLPAVQGRTVPDEVHVATGEPDWSFRLDVPGLCFAASRPPLRLELRDAATGARMPWHPATLADSGPLDAVYEFDAATRRVTFGNGVNGRIVPAGAAMLVTYAVSDGEGGRAAANHRWRLDGFAAPFGVNLDAMAGGAAATDWRDDRREARRRARDDRALVSAEDIVAAALALPLLEVVRAWVPRPDDGAPRTGVVTLVAMRARTPADGAGGRPESPRWLEGVRRRLAPRIPLGTRLAVTAPVYVPFAVRATVYVADGRDPAAVQAAVASELARRLAVTGMAARQPGVPVHQRDLVAWMRGVDGVARVAGLRLVSAAGVEAERIGVPRRGLPLCDFAASAVDFRRAGQGVPS